jgi:hypothetical protein
MTDDDQVVSQNIPVEQANIRENTRPTSADPAFRSPSWRKEKSAGFKSPAEFDWPGT